MRYSTPWGAFTIATMPGCPQLAIVHGTYIRPEHRGQGKGRAQHATMLATAKALGYDAITCTARTDNAAQCAILEYHGWTRTEPPFVSTVTGHEVALWYLVLEKGSDNCTEDSAERTERLRNLTKFGFTAGGAGGG